MGKVRLIAGIISLVLFSIALIQKKLTVVSTLNKGIFAIIIAVVIYEIYNIVLKKS
ncbi:hypothetical protein [Clostridium arbusti]|uniref:hypothetical protein n=1 Tax=Clostridium arbusti TaxID=1137848 RepID=UPI0003148DE3|nr:hypothetical protein [Clostridium arbusti]